MLLGKHPKDMTDEELKNLYDTYNSGIVMYEHQIDKGQLLVREMKRRGIYSKED